MDGEHWWHDLKMWIWSVREEVGGGYEFYCKIKCIWV